jgi:O-acetyl-ADP-ribose deacetylase (regulator of RNase III)
MTQSIPVGAAELELTIDDITLLKVDAFVFYAQSNLKLGSGFGSAVSVRGGPSIKKELADLEPLEVGEATATAGGNLNARFIIHAVGPKFQESNTEAKLRTTVLSSLRCAEKKGVKTLAFPPMGAGFYGVPLPLCAKVMIETIIRYLESGSCLEKVSIVALDSREFRVFKRTLEALNQKEVVT